MRSARGSETAGKNRPGYEGAAHEKQGSILAEGAGFVAAMFVQARIDRVSPWATIRDVVISV